MKRIVYVIILFTSFCSVYGQPGVSKKSWWLASPVSLIQTNLRETDDGLDPKALIKAIKSFPANTLLFGVGGIVAHYPTSVSFHYRSSYLPAGKDLVGDVIKEAHANGIRVIGRFDFSRARKEVYDAHPEWFYQRKDGGPVVDDNGLHSSCINGGYYNDKALEIMGEALERYEADGVFINWFGNVRNDYKGNSIGLCHCRECEQKFNKQYGRSIPDEADAEYNEFIFRCAVEVATKFRDLIHTKRPGALFMTYIDESTDALVSEADLYKSRPLPQWVYSASEQVNSQLNIHPDKFAVDLVMPYHELKYRFATVAGPVLRMQLYQNIAQGSFPAFVVLGTMDQPDKTGLKAAQPVFQWFEKYGQQLYGQQSAARVILYGKTGPAGNRGSGDYRGFYRLLSELHIPFKVTNNVKELNTRDIDLVIIPNDSTPAALQSYIEAGGSVLTVGITQPSFIPGKKVKLWDNTTSSYMRIEDSTLFPSLKDTRTLLCEGRYLELEPTTPAPLTLIPPGQFGPPEKVATTDERTTKPGLIIKSIGKGKVAFIPWQISDLYYKFGDDKHRMFISDLIDHLLPGHKRQLITTAHPTVEVTIMKQNDQKRSVVHLVNMSGHAGNTFFDAIEMRNISLRVKGVFKKATSIDGKQLYPVEVAGGYTRFVLPVLKDYSGVFLYE
jgi:Hypothetical glycosyl hydrolase 6